MGMREEFEAAGNWLFRRRGYLPLLLFPLLLLAASGDTAQAGGSGLGAVWEAFCVAVALGGLALRIATVGFVPKDTSQRNTGRPQAETLNTTGLYSVVRHPLYVGNYLMWLGVALFTRAWWAPVIVSLVFWLYYERIMFAEEEFLRSFSLADLPMVGPKFQQRLAALGMTTVPHVLQYDLPTLRRLCH